MKLISFMYFKKGSSFCKDDFKNKERVLNMNMNIDAIESISDPEFFIMPYTNDNTDLSYSILTTKSGNQYCLKGDESRRVLKELIEFEVPTDF